jgi:hypothetical protein
MKLFSTAVTLARCSSRFSRQFLFHKKAYYARSVLAICLALLALSYRPSLQASAPQPRPPLPAIHPRTIYQYSVVPGGVHTPEELAIARRTDPVVAAHFADFGVNTQITTLKEDMYAYVSYRKGDKVFYTRKKHKVCKGEVVITDGRNYARTRCANRLRTTLRPGKPPKMPALPFDEPKPADFDVLVLSPPWQDFGSQPVGGAPGPSASVAFPFTGVSAPTLSLSGKDFSVGPPTCNAAFTTCTATVTFSPLLPGLRKDALVAADTSGVKQIATLVRGIGIAPQLAFSPGVISTLAGNGTWGYADATNPTSASFRNPQGIASDSAGNLYIADSINMVVRRVDALTGSVTTIAGNGRA